MTPKEKAEELRQEFVFRIEDIIQPKTWDEVESLNTLIYKVAKECAELAVDEIIKSEPRNSSDVDQAELCRSKEIVLEMYGMQQLLITATNMRSKFYL